MDTSFGARIEGLGAAEEEEMVADVIVIGGSREFVTLAAGLDSMGA